MQCVFLYNKQQAPFSTAILTETRLRCQAWAIEFPCLHVLTLDSGDCLHNEHMFALCLRCVHVEGGILSLGTLFFFCSASTTAPISLGVHGWSGGNEEKLLSMSFQSSRNSKHISTFIPQLQDPKGCLHLRGLCNRVNDSCCRWNLSVSLGSVGLCKCCTTLSFFSGSKSMPHLSPQSYIDSQTTVPAFPDVLEGLIRDSVLQPV